MKNCVVIGGGVIGLCSAYYLAKAGHKVKVIDRSDMSSGCSYVNAGLVVPSHVIPLAQPGMLSKGIKWMMDSSSPFYVKPRLSIDLLSWGWNFYKNSSANHVNRSMPALRDISLFSKELYRDIAEEAKAIEYEEKGLMMLYLSGAIGEEENAAGEVAKKMGLEVDFLSKKDIQALEGGIDTNAIGGVHYRDDAHLSPMKFMTFLKEELAKLEVQLLKNEWVEDFSLDKGKISCIRTNNQEIVADEFVLCSGSWSPIIARKLGIKLKILPGKGYSFDLDGSGSMPTIPSILCEGKVAVTPFSNSVRFGGTMEITHVKDRAINVKRLKGIANTVQDFYPGLGLDPKKLGNVNYGFRPCTPTGLPIISRNQKVSNLIIASGHGMMGLSLGPATGYLVEELVREEKTSIDLSLMA